MGYSINEPRIEFGNKTLNEKFDIDYIKNKTYNKFTFNEEIVGEMDSFDKHLIPKKEQNRINTTANFFGAFTSAAVGALLGAINE